MVPSIEKNIGVIRNTGTELTFDAMVLQRRALSWHVGMNLSNDNNVLVSLNKGRKQPFCANGGNLKLGGSGCCCGWLPTVQRLGTTDSLVSFADVESRWDYRSHVRFG